MTVAEAIMRAIGEQRDRDRLALIGYFLAMIREAQR